MANDSETGTSVTYSIHDGSVSYSIGPFSGALSETERARLMENTAKQASLVFETLFKHMDGVQRAKSATEDNQRIHSLEGEISKLKVDRWNRSVSSFLTFGLFTVLVGLVLFMSTRGQQEFSEICFGILLGAAVVRPTGQQHDSLPSSQVKSVLARHGVLFLLVLATSLIPGICLWAASTWSIAHGLVHIAFLFCGFLIILLTTIAGRVLNLSNSLEA